MAPHGHHDLPVLPIKGPVWFPMLNLDECIVVLVTTTVLAYVPTEVVVDLSARFG